VEHRHRIDTADVKAQTNLPALVSQAVPLRKVAAQEYAGACPRCGGVDRLHVNSAYGWMCRQCHPKWADAIEWVRFLHRVSFQEAIAMLGGAKTMPTTNFKPAQRTSPPPAKGWDDATRARHMAHLQRCQAAMDGSDGEAYLVDRGFCPDTWRAYGMGYDTQRAAIALPWFRSGRLVALNYRRIRTLSKGDRFTAESGGTRSGVLFGGQALAPGLSDLLPNGTDPLSSRSLMLVEGELNCASIWQAVYPLVDVLSFGAQGGSTPDGFLPIAARYRCVIVWKDEETKAKEEVGRIPGASAIWSTTATGKRDANDRLQDGTLRNAIARVLLRVTKPEHQTALAHDLYDAALVSA
jgi:ribosomal protein L37AE/L43A